MRVNDVIYVSSNINNIMDSVPNPNILCYIEISTMEMLLLFQLDYLD